MPDSVLLKAFVMLFDSCEILENHSLNGERVNVQNISCASVRRLLLVAASSNASNEGDLKSAGFAGLAACYFQR